MAWIYVFLAGIVELFWVIGLRYSNNLFHWSGTIIMIIFSFFFIIRASEKLPAGTVYAVFTGIGASGIVLIDFIFFGADFSVMKILLIGLIIMGVIGIKLTSDDKSNPKKESGAIEREGA